MASSLTNLIDLPVELLVEILNLCPSLVPLTRVCKQLSLLAVSSRHELALKVPGGRRIARLLTDKLASASSVWPVSVRSLSLVNCVSLDDHLLGLLLPLVAGSLSSLDISSCRSLTSRSLMAVGLHLRRLTRLTAQSMANMHEFGLRDLTSLTNLADLNLKGGSQFRLELPNLLLCLPRLKSVNFSNTAFNNECIELFLQQQSQPHSPRLIRAAPSSLCLDHLSPSYVEAPFLTQFLLSMTHLSCLSLRYANSLSVNNEVLAAVGLASPSLNELWLDGCLGVGDAGLWCAAQRLVALTSLSLTGCMNISAVALMDCLPPLAARLNLLHLGRTQTNDAVLQALAPLQLRTLVVDACPSVSSIGLAAVAQAAGGSLLRVSAKDCRLVTSLAFFVDHCPSLSHLDLKGTAALPSDVHLLLIGLSHLTSLNLNGCGSGLTNEQLVVWLKQRVSSEHQLSPVSHIGWVDGLMLHCGYQTPNPDLALIK